MYKSHEAWKNIFNRKQQIDNSLVKLHKIMLGTHSAILQSISEEKMLKYICMGYGYACVWK